MARGKKYWLTGMISLALLVSGCSQASESSTGGTTSGTTTPAVQMRTVKDAGGEVSIPLHPTRIADVSGSTEELLALGIQPILSGNTQYESPQELTPILQKELGSTVSVAGWFQNEVSIEAIAAANPDVILAGPTQEKIYDQLSKIAPTVRVPYGFNAFRDRFAFIAETFDKKAQMEEWLQAYDATAKDWHDQIAASTKKETFAVIEATSKEIRIYAKTGVADMIFADLKLPKAPGIPDPDPWGGKVTSLEGLSSLNPDHVVLLADSDQNVLEQSQIWNHIKAKQKGNVYRITTKQSYNEAFFALGKKAILDQLASEILKQNRN